MPICDELLAAAPPGNIEQLFYTELDPVLTVL